MVNGYDAGFAVVVRNGFTLGNDDVNITSGTDIVLLVDADVDDIIQIWAFGSFVLADHYTKSEVDVIADLKADQATTYTKIESDVITDTKVDETATAQTKIGDLTIGETVAVTSWSYSTTTITVNTSAIHNLSVGQYFSVSGLVADTNAPNGRWAVATVVDTDTITFTAVDTPTGTETVSSAEMFHGMIKSNLFLNINNEDISSIGVSQTWQDVTASRAAAVTYTNTSEKPIQVIIYTNYAANQAASILVDGVERSRQRMGSDGTAELKASVIVPINSTYLYSGTIQKWHELKGV